MPLPKPRQILKKTKRTFQIGKNAAILGHRVLNPVNLTKMGVRTLQGKGTILPGSKYIGPGNSLRKGKPRSVADRMAFQHDLDYDNYLKQAKLRPLQVYGSYSDADRRLLRGARKTAHKDPSSLAVYAGMGAKALGAKIGLLPTIHDKKVYGPSGKPSTPHEMQKVADNYQSQIPD
jgi:hypothetical protein